MTGGADQQPTGNEMDLCQWIRNLKKAPKGVYHMGQSNITFVIVELCQKWSPLFYPTRQGNEHIFKVPKSGGCVAEVQTTCTPPPAPKCPDGDGHMLGPRAIYHIFGAQVEKEVIW